MFAQTLAKLPKHLLDRLVELLLAEGKLALNLLQDPRNIWLELRLFRQWQQIRRRRRCRGSHLAGFVGFWRRSCALDPDVLNPQVAFRGLPAGQNREYCYEICKN